MNPGDRQERSRPEHRASEQGRYGRERHRSDESRFGSDEINRGPQRFEGGGNPRYAPESYADDDFGGQSGRHGSGFGEGREGQERNVYSGGYSGQGRGDDARDPDNLSGSRYRSRQGRGGYGSEYGGGERYGGYEGSGQGGYFGGEYGRGYGGDYGRGHGERGRDAPAYGQGAYGREMGRSDQGMRLGERSGTEWGFNDSWRSMDRPRYGEARQRRGPKGYTRSDERIKDDVCDRLMDRDDIDLEEVSIEVHNGKVRLEGTVPERRMKHVIEDIACSCTGVRDVENHVRVGRGESESGDSGARLSAATRGSSTRTRQ